MLKFERVEKGERLHSAIVLVTFSLKTAIDIVETAVIQLCTVQTLAHYIFLYIFLTATVYFFNRKVMY